MVEAECELIDYVACFLLVAAACEFGLGEQENSDKTENPSENYALGLALSLITIGISAFQSNVTDRILRDYGATVGENMLWTNAVGAIFIFFFVVLLEPHAFMFFGDTPLYFMLLTFRSVSFFFGSVVIHHHRETFRRRTCRGDNDHEETVNRHRVLRVLCQ